MRSNRFVDSRSWSLTSPPARLASVLRSLKLRSRWHRSAGAGKTNGGHRPMTRGASSIALRPQENSIRFSSSGRSMISLVARLCPVMRGDWGWGQAIGVMAPPMPRSQTRQARIGKMKLAVRSGCMNGSTAFVITSLNKAIQCRSVMPMAVNCTAMFAHKRTAGLIITAIS